MRRACNLSERIKKISPFPNLQTSVTTVYVSRALSLSKRSIVATGIVARGFTRFCIRAACVRERGSKYGSVRSCNLCAPIEEHARPRGRPIPVQQQGLTRTTANAFTKEKRHAAASPNSCSLRARNIPTSRSRARIGVKQPPPRSARRHCGRSGAEVFYARTCRLGHPCTRPVY